MTDYFALLDQPRAPWLDLDNLKNAYHAKAREIHPDRRPTQADSTNDETFATLNEAYQVLQDPKRRLHHLLSLADAAPSSGQPIPQPLQSLFPAISALVQRAKVLLEKLSTTSNKLSQSLLKPQILELQSEVRATRQQIQNLLDTALRDLRQINELWAKNPRPQISALSSLYVTFAYLTRWLSQLDEIAFQLSMH